MAKYYPGEQHVISFTVPDIDGNNTSGLTWTVKLFTKDGAKVTSGAEYASIACSNVGTDFYKIVFTPDDDSTSDYTIVVISNATVPDYFEEQYEPLWDRVYFEADMTHDETDPEEVSYKLPGGAVLSQFQLDRVPPILTREKQ